MSLGKARRNEGRGSRENYLGVGEVKKNEGMESIGSEVK